MCTVQTAARFPIRLVESGPAGGAILAARIAARAGISEVLSFDVGGTTAKLCLIDNARPQTSRQFEIARAALGADGDLRFWKLITDNELYWATGHDHGVSFRVRGEVGDDVPLQKQAALGGWGSLRGYDFKEYRGDAFVLASMEYRLSAISATLWTMARSGSSPL